MRKLVAHAVLLKFTAFYRIIRLERIWVVFRRGVEDCTSSNHKGCSGEATGSAAAAATAAAATWAAWPCCRWRGGGLVRLGDGDSCAAPPHGADRREGLHRLRQQQRRRMPLGTARSDPKRSCCWRLQSLNII